MTTVARIALQPFSYAIAVATFFLTILPGSLISLPFSLERRVAISGPFWKLCSTIILRISTLSKVYIEDRRPLNEKESAPKGLYITNHQSFVDIPLIISCLQIPPIMKKEVLYIPILGLCGYASGALIVDRKSATSRRTTLIRAQQRLLKGLKALQVYPEGTRQKLGDGPKDYSFIKKALLKYAFEKNLPVYPISMYGTKRVINSKTGFINHGQKVGIIIKEALRPDLFQSSDEFMENCWNEAHLGYSELQEKLT